MCKAQNITIKNIALYGCTVADTGNDLRSGGGRICITKSFLACLGPISINLGLKRIASDATEKRNFSYWGIQKSRICKGFDFSILPKPIGSVWVMRPLENYRMFQAYRCVFEFEAEKTYCHK